MVEENDGIGEMIRAWGENLVDRELDEQIRRRCMDIYEEGQDRVVPSGVVLTAMFFLSVSSLAAVFVLVANATAWLAVSAVSRGTF